MKTIDELKQRLLDVEIEQERQDAQLYWLGDLYEKVRELEALLANIDSYQTQPVAECSNFEKLRNLDEINRIEAELAQMDDYEPQDDNETHYFEEIQRLRKTLRAKMSGLTEETVTLSKPAEPPPLAREKVTVSKSARGVAPPSMTHKVSDVSETHRLEAELLRMDNYEPQSDEELKYLAEIQNAKSQLRNPANKNASSSPQRDDKMTHPIASTKPVMQEKSPVKSAVTPQKQNSTPSGKGAVATAPAKVERGYVIRLMYDQRKLTEWSDESGGGWRECGKGQCYANAQDVKKSLLKLKKRWPNYPLKIVKR